MIWAMHHVTTRTRCDLVMRNLTFAPTRGRGRWLTNVRRFSPVAVRRVVRFRFVSAPPDSTHDYTIRDAQGQKGDQNQDCLRTAVIFGKRNPKRQGTQETS
jgi:hypothetical protein